MKRSDFYYDLPNEFIAQYPLKDRASSRLLVLHQDSTHVEHKCFTDIVDYFNKDDILVLNNTKVIPARLFGIKETGGKVEILLLQEIENGVWEVLLRPSSRVKEGTRITFNANGFYCCAIDSPGKDAIRRVRFCTKNNFWEVLKTIGTVPLPSYIKRKARRDDSDAYQTVFAEKRGAVAAPTAGLHFTPALLAQLRKKGVEIVYITLHVGYGTFRPVKEDNIQNHIMHREYYEISERAAHSINNATRDGRRIIACGTTTVRALESAANEQGSIAARTEFTDIFIYPPYQFKIVNGLITNFHLPESTLLMLVAAFAGREKVHHAYEEAKKEKYRFFSYGDAMLIT
ncbi:MAG: tRNA preQ1(34) S-adenosylmethionine ribosyltransferase-isomerase QueA [Candidatus Omnitrophica bacterium]|nr:tRNA preQ1(34) S-adenosylmethionine ribosyltransferase-isomerase QueA [Candidatus Omnitrophota bacterium]